jgi:hypothetical protein
MNDSSDDEEYHSCDESDVTRVTTPLDFIDLSTVRVPQTDALSASSTDTLPNSAKSQATTTVVPANSGPWKRTTSQQRRWRQRLARASAAIVIQRMYRGRLVRARFSYHHRLHDFYCACCRRKVALNRAQFTSILRAGDVPELCFRCHSRRTVNTADNHIVKARKAIITGKAPRPDPMPESDDGMLLVLASGWASFTCTKCDKVCALNPNQHTAAVNARDNAYPPSQCGKCNRKSPCPPAGSRRLVWAECRNCGDKHRHTCDFFRKIGAHRVSRFAWQCRACHLRRHAIKLQTAWRRRSARKVVARLRTQRRDREYAEQCGRRERASRHLQAWVRRWIVQRRYPRKNPPPRILRPPGLTPAVPQPAARSARPVATVLRADAPVYISMQQQANVAQLVRESVRAELVAHTRAQQRYYEAIWEQQRRTELERRANEYAVRCMHSDSEFQATFPPLPTDK